jgi:hypothetical protein
MRCRSTLSLGSRRSSVGIRQCDENTEMFVFLRPVLSDEMVAGVGCVHITSYNIIITTNQCSAVISDLFERSRKA